MIAVEFRGGVASNLSVSKGARLLTLACFLAACAGCSGSGQAGKEKKEDSTGREKTDQELTQNKENLAKVQMATLTQAAKVYQVTNDTPPASLEELTRHQPNGGKPLVPAKDLTDPWGRPYQYDPAGSHNQGLQVDVWCVTPEGKTIGNWQK